MEIRKSKRRVQTQDEAAAFLGLDRSRLYEMKSKPAPWWQDWFYKKGEGYDVCAIAAAQAAFHARDRGTFSTTTTAEGLKDGQEYQDQVLAANLMTAVETGLAKRLDRQAKERKAMFEDGRVVGADVVCRVLQEAFGFARETWEDLPWVFSRECPPEFRDFLVSFPSMLPRSDGLIPGVSSTVYETRWLVRKLVFNPAYDPSIDGEQDEEPALLQSLVETRLVSFGQWLDNGAGEVSEEIHEQQSGAS